MRDSILLQAYRDHEPALVRFLTRRLKCRFTAADVAHEVYLRLLADGAEAGVRNGKAYLFRMAANLATDHQRIESRRAEILAQVNELLWGGPDSITPERHALARAELAHLAAAVRTLPERTRRVFALSRFEGKSQREIAAVLGVSSTTVEKHLGRALDRLHDAHRAFEGGSSESGEG
jgi:RNA polymerase sigma factor (sigma-70 family)